jgi:hypothetical protein
MGFLGYMIISVTGKKWRKLAMGDRSAEEKWRKLAKNFMDDAIVFKELQGSFHQTSSWNITIQENADIQRFTHEDSHTWVILPSAFFAGTLFCPLELATRQANTALPD